MNPLVFDNAFVRDLPGDPEHGARLRQVEGALHSRVVPTAVAAPRVLAYSPEMAAELGFTPADVAGDAFAQTFGGNALLPGMQPYATNYGGHQFGNWAGQLGDGRAIGLGELINAAGRRWELQLKGAGRTPYSRGADGRAVLRSSVREFLCSEAMHHLGVPTTRALSLVATGETVERDMFYDGHPRDEPGAIVCRAAPSFIRFGHFELPSSRGDTALLRQLVDFTIRRDFPELEGSGEALYAEWFGQVCERTAHLMAHWMRVGFVHGVMNTDNMSILGLTIDYGPYGWLEDFDPDWTPNTTDAGRRRYRYGQQPQVAWWNLSRLAGALSPLFQGIEALQAGLDRYAAAFQANDRMQMAAKLGLEHMRDDDVSLAQGLHDLLQQAEVDMTLFFRGLTEIDPAKPSWQPVADAFYDVAKRDASRPAFDAWMAQYAQRVAQDDVPVALRRERMRAVNPRYVLRNYLAQEAIDLAERGDASGIQELLDVLRHPYVEQPGKERFAQRRPEWARTRAGCSMLSCSS
ncbi:MAG TPA: YdiU family protein [Dyella sp.]|uniref:protein adenylyltransferase SelO n=1 Tax=Dyella sp. TaxID=1869338 RepID=UPI002F94F9B7